MNVRERSATVIPVALALVTLAIHTATNGNYGYHGDELYYIASGHHLAFGYVDYPPLVPLWAHLDGDRLILKTPRGSPREWQRVHAAEPVAMSA
jgi:hypothetical protein